MTSVDFRYVAAGLLGALCLVSWFWAPTGPRIAHVASNVDGFELILDDTGTTPATAGLFDVGYAIKANYGHFTYRGKSYRSVGGGSVVIRAAAAPAPRYVVRETPLSHDKHGAAERSLLQVEDRQTGQELGRRGLVAHAVEDSHGWTGDHAIKFVRQVLQSPHPPGRPWGVEDYDMATADVVEFESTDSAPYTRQDAPGNCPETLRIERRQPQAALIGPAFEFQPRNPLKFVACDTTHVVVASGVYASNLHLDLLTLDGEPVAQGYVRLPLPLKAHWANLSDVTIQGSTIEFVIAANQQDDKFRHSPYGRVQLKVHLRSRTDLACRHVGSETNFSSCAS